MTHTHLACLALALVSLSAAPLTAQESDRGRA